jgi:hypothetical protein
LIMSKPPPKLPWKYDIIVKTSLVMVIHSCLVDISLGPIIVLSQVHPTHSLCFEWLLLRGGNYKSMQSSFGLPFVGIFLIWTVIGLEGTTYKAKARIIVTPLWPSVRMKLTLPKLGTWSPPGLPNV